MTKTCGQCNVTFLGLASYESHLSACNAKTIDALIIVQPPPTPLPAPPKPSIVWACPVCRREYGSKSWMVRHMRTSHQRKPERRATCSQCQQTFAYTSPDCVEIHKQLYCPILKAPQEIIIPKDDGYVCVCVCRRSHNILFTQSASICSQGSVVTTTTKSPL